MTCWIVPIAIGGSHLGAWRGQQVHSWWTKDWQAPPKSDTRGSSACLRLLSTAVCWCMQMPRCTRSSAVASRPACGAWAQGEDQRHRRRSGPPAWAAMRATPRLGQNPGVSRRCPHVLTKGECPQHATGSGGFADSPLPVNQYIPVLSPRAINHAACSCLPCVEAVDCMHSDATVLLQKT